MTDEILRNGVPHNVTTSLVTRNAVLPQNIFIKEDVSAPRDSDMDDSASSLVTQDSSGAFDQTASKPAPQATPSYPITTDKLATNDALNTIKSHIRDNIQALKNLAQSDNRQGVGVDAFNQNMQSLGASRSIEETKLYLEKKSIKSNRQLISKTTTDRSAPNLTTSHESAASDLDTGGPQTQATKSQSTAHARNGELGPDQDNALQMRIKQLKGHVRNVDSTLQNLDPDK